MLPVDSSDPLAPSAPSPFRRKPCYACANEGPKCHLQSGLEIRPGISFSCASASDTLNKVLELELQRFENITLRDAAGRRSISTNRNVSTILRQPSVEFKLGCLAISPVD
jgi:hypothetical protein